MLKPDALARGLKDEIFNRVKGQGFRIVGKKEIKVTADQAEQLYEVHKEKPFFHGLVKFITSGPVIVSILEKENAVSDLRRLMGATDPRVAEAGTIRGDLKEENIFSEMGTMKNLVHGSDSKESFDREIPIFFNS